jgi:hypothetical protein
MKEGKRKGEKTKYLYVHVLENRCQKDCNFMICMECLFYATNLRQSEKNEKQKISVS